MNRCDRCGAPMLTTWSADGGWMLRCPQGCAVQLCDRPPEDEGARAAAQHAAAGLGWYALEDADDAALDRAEACFHQARLAAPDDLAVAWAELLCRFGVRWHRAGDDAALLMHRMALSGRRMTEEADYIRLLDRAAGTDALSYFKDEAQRVDRLLAQIQALQGEDGYDVFVALRAEEGGEPTAEKRFCDAAVDQLTRVYGVGRVFYAPQTLCGRTAEEFEAYVHEGLRTARLLVVVADSAAHADAPWVRSEWRRYLAREDGRTAVCCLGDMRPDALPAPLAAQQVIAAADPGEAGGVAGQIYRLLTEPPREVHETPETLYNRGRELLKSRPDKAAQLLLKAAQGKHSAAQLLLGRCHERGVGVKQNLKEARRWYLAAAGRGMTEARAALDALALYADAERGVPSAQAALGAALLDAADGFPPDPAEAARWLREAAAQGDPDGAFLYGCMLTEGYGVPEDRRQGRRLLNQARADGSQAAAAYLRNGRAPWRS